MTRPLILAVPSKGRLQENVQAFFARAGMPLNQARGARDYRGTLGGVENVEVAYLSASEIAAALSSGTVHLGVTGEDLVREGIAEADARVALLEKLGFGHANVVVAVPAAWIDVRGMADLDDVASHFHTRTGRRVRVATKYVNLTRSFFAGGAGPVPPTNPTPPPASLSPATGSSIIGSSRARGRPRALRPAARRS